MNNSSDLPEAGWYVDPANASNERWWGGLEWTDTTRALPVKSAPRPHPAQPVFSGSFPPPNTPVTSTGGFPAAAAPAQSIALPPASPAAALPPAAPAAAPAPAFAIAPSTSPSSMLAISAPAASTGGFSIGGPSQAVAIADAATVGLAGWVPAQPPPGVSELSLAAGYGSTGTAPNDAAVSPTWYATAGKFLGPTPKNPQATAGLLMSILLAPLGFIFSIVALAKASRIHRDGFAPVGRRRAGWGLTLSIMSLIAIPIGISVGIPMLQHEQELRLEQLAAANSGTDEVPAGQVPIPLAAYDRATFEQGLAEGFTQTSGGAPDSVTCPDTVETTVGSSITCEIVYQETPHTMTMTITNDAGNYTVAVDGVVQE